MWELWSGTLMGVATYLARYMVVDRSRIIALFLTMGIKWFYMYTENTSFLQRVKGTGGLRGSENIERENCLFKTPDPEICET